MTSPEKPELRPNIIEPKTPNKKGEEDGRVAAEPPASVIEDLVANSSSTSEYAIGYSRGLTGFMVEHHFPNGLHKPVNLNIAKGMQGFVEGLNRRSPTEQEFIAESNSTSDFTKGYKIGFAVGVAKDYNLPIDFVGVPEDQGSYDAFLSGLAAAEYPGLSDQRGVYNWNGPDLDDSYELGLKVLLVHLDPLIKQVESKDIHLRMRNPKLLERYRKDAYSIFQSLPKE